MRTYADFYCVMEQQFTKLNSLFWKKNLRSSLSISVALAAAFYMANITGQTVYH